MGTGRATLCDLNNASSRPEYGTGKMEDLFRKTISQRYRLPEQQFWVYEKCGKASGANRLSNTRIPNDNPGTRSVGDTAIRCRYKI